MAFTELESINLNTDDSETQDIFINSDSSTLYTADLQNIYIGAADDSYSVEETHSRIINSVKTYSIKSSYLSQLNETTASNPVSKDTESAAGSSNEAGAAGFIVGANAYMLTEYWGHEYTTSYDATYYFADAEKHNSTSAGDYLLCWAAVASNILQWGGWADGINNGTFESEQDVLGQSDILFSGLNGTYLGYYGDGLASNWNSIGTYSADWEVVVA